MDNVKKAIRHFFKTADIFLLVVCLLSSAFSIVLISSAARTLSGGATRYIIVQAAATLIGVICFVIFSLIDVEDLTRYWKIFLLFNVGFILTLVPFGTTVNGNRSWLIFDWFPVDIQPAEIVKITYIILMAKQMYYLRERINHISSLAQILAHLGLMLAVIYFASSDMGMLIVYFMIFLAMSLASGIYFRWFAAGFAVIGAAAPFIWRYIFDDYQRNRILVVFNPELDPLGTGYHAIQSKKALGAGKLFGQGLYQGTQTQSSALPAKHTDFIFSVAGEELGMIGCLAIIALLTIIIIRCIYVATKARSGMSAMICVGIAGMLMFQSFENIGMCLGITPIIGLTLPFFSYGGSSMVTMYCAMGIISSIKMRPMPHWLKDSNKYA